MTKEEYQKKIDELNEQKDALRTQIEQLHEEFRNSLFMELEEQGITPGTKVSVKIKTLQGNEIDIETYFFWVCLVWGKMECIFHKIEKDGTMSQTEQHIQGQVISIHKI